jgi:hypothetical protein
MASRPRRGTRIFSQPLYSQSLTALLFMVMVTVVGYWARLLFPS